MGGDRVHLTQHSEASKGRPAAGPGFDVPFKDLRNAFQNREARGRLIAHTLPAVARLLRLLFSRLE